MKQMFKKTMNLFFGERALQSIPRVNEMTGGGVGLERWWKVLISCPCCKNVKIEEISGMCGICKFNYLSEDKMVVSFKNGIQLEYQEACKLEKEATLKCEKCRGYASSDINCVQRDCKNLYKRASYHKNCEKLKLLLKSAFDID